MLPQFPKVQGQYPRIDLKETDGDLPSHVANKNNMRYASFKTLAKGGKCLIQACKDFHLRRTVCYKSLLPRFADDPHEQKRFLREARVTAMLQHPNTVPVYELSRDNKGHYYFTMKLIEGLTLREILDQLKRDQTATTEWTLDRLIEILLQVGHALDYAHNHGVVHRDIKPANIVVGPFGEVLLLDWGLAKVWDMAEAEIPQHSPEQNVDQTLTAMSGAQATPLYMSPEQVAEVTDIDHRTDIYSMGAILYEALTLEYMAWGNTMHEMLSHTEHDAPPKPSEKAPHRDIPPHLEQTCLRCIEKEPAARFQTTEELIRALSQR